MHRDRFAIKAESPGTLVLVDPVCRDQFFEPLLVNGSPFRLKVGAAVALVAGAFPVEAQPCHAFKDRSPGLVGVAGLIGILHAENKCSAVMAGVEPVKKRCSGTSDMKVSGGRGSKASADGMRHLAELYSGRAVRATGFAGTDEKILVKRLPWSR